MPLRFPPPPHVDVLLILALALAGVAFGSYTVLMGLVLYAAARALLAR
jgi:hypothetical protein